MEKQEGRKTKRWMGGWEGGREEGRGGEEGRKERTKEQKKERTNDDRKGDTPAILKTKEPKGSYKGAQGELSGWKQGIQSHLLGPPPPPPSMD